MLLLLRPGFIFLAAMSALGYFGYLLGRFAPAADLVVLGVLVAAGAVGFGLGRTARSAAR